MEDDDRHALAHGSVVDLGKREGGGTDEGRTEGRSAGK